MKDDPLMGGVVDLDEVAAVLAGRTVGWRSAGLEVGQATWRDAEASWPQPLETELFRGGWADVDFIAGLDDVGSLPASDIASASDFETRMNQWVARVFGVCEGAQ
ncbi:hypothetical protein AB0L35_10640 [Streptomyces sp. NPDC052309]|uniref:hypothetical protein n=1 Tax=Streptomyces sp. NPDC052309 TaxID=3155421 RepID=UPI00341B0AA3